MKTIAAVLLSLAMLASVPFIGPDASSNPFAASGQVVRKSKRKGKYVVRRSWNGSKWVYTKVRVKTYSPRRKTWRTGRKVVSRSKKIILLK